MRVAMVSGAGRGLGRAIAEHLGQQGWALSLGVRDLSQVADMTGDTVLATPFDAQIPLTHRHGWMRPLSVLAGWMH